MRQIDRDPFARRTLCRENVQRSGFSGTRECSWCGGVNKAGGLFKYHWHNDGILCGNRDDIVPGLFCSVSCMRSYHGG